MSNLELRPLSTGEILDRTFTLYRRHFLFFVGLAAIPRLPGLAASLAQQQMTIGETPGIFTTISLVMVTYALILVGYLFSQGATILGVSELYLGRTTTIADSLRRVGDQLGSLFGVLLLSGLAIVFGFILFIVPGVIAMCRLMVCVPVVISEKKGASDSFSRSWELTKGYAWRAFLILLLYFVISLGFGMLASAPLIVGILRDGVQAAAQDRGLLALQAVLSAGLEALLTPVLLIATSVYYYDLRVRKEAFDLQFMMNPEEAHASRTSLPTILPEGQ